MTVPLVAFVGVLAPSEDRSGNPAFSQAGSTFQESLIRSLATAGINVDTIFAQRPTTSYPHSRRLVFLPASGTAGVLPVTFLPFVNFGAIKTITSGVALFVSLLRWSWANRRHQGRVLLLYNVSSPPGIASVLAGRVTGAKVIAVIADIQVPGSGSVANSVLRRLDYRLQTFTMARCDGLVVLTNRMVTDFAPDVPSVLVEGAVPPQMTLLYAGADEQGDTGSTNCETDPIILMFAGELSELKGIPTLLDAFARIPNSAVKLWITGRGPEQPRVEAAAAADDRIRYWGYPSYEELLALYAQATLLVNPHSMRHLSSRYLFPSKLIEYLATGIPVLTTPSTPEVAELYGRFTYVATDDSVEALAHAITRAISHRRSELRAKGAAGRAFVLHEKTWEVQGRRVAAFIGEVLGGESYG